MTTQLLPRAQDVFITHELNHLLRDIQQLKRILGGPIISLHQRAIIETVRNEILKREELRDGEMRIRVDSDQRKSVGYLFFVLKKLKWPQVQVKAVGEAIRTMHGILEEFRNTLKGY